MFTERPSTTNRDCPLRVLFVIPGAENDTSMSFSRRQATSVRQCGIDVHPFYLQSRTSPVGLLREWKRLRRAIREIEPNVVHAHFGTMTAFVASVASRRPLVITFHGSDLNPAPGDAWLRSIAGRILSRFAAKRASRIICVSHQLAQRLRHISQRVHVLPCGVNLCQFRPQPKHQCRRALGWSDSEMVVLFNARTDPIGKRLDLAKATIACAGRSIPNLRLHVFRGTTHPDEMPLYYSAADALLMTSDFEGSPMVVKEAMACELPVVSVDVGDVTDLLAGVSASVIAPRDPFALSKGLVELLRLNVRSNGRERMQHLSDANIAHRVAAVYRLAAGSGLCGMPTGEQTERTRVNLTLAPLYPADAQTSMRAA